MTCRIKNSVYALLLALGSTAFFPGCTSNNNDTSNDTENLVTPRAQSAVIATVAADFTSGAHAVFSTEAPFEGVTQQVPTISDITVTCDGEYFYRIERFSGENVSRFHITKPDEVLSQYSTQDSSGTETASSNPYGLVFVNETKAYLLRYGSEKAWIVNPSAATEAEYKIGELDLSAYSVDGSPNMSSGIIVGDRLYLVLQRLDQTFAPQDAYVAVFDTATDTEIDTAPDSDGLKGILLPVKNPGDIEALAANGLLYIQGTGRFGSSFSKRDPEYTGGIATIDPANGYATQLILDDGDAQSHPAGLFTGMEIISENKGYLIGYAGFTDNTLFSFDPSSGTFDVDTNGLPVPVNGIKNTSVRSLAQDSKKQLWVSIADDAAPGVTVLNGADGSVVKDRIPTTLNPSTIAICDAAAQ